MKATKASNSTPMRKAPSSEKCFVIMPFSETIHGDNERTSKQQWDHIFTSWIKRAVESYKKQKLICRRSPALPGNFVRGIVADLSDDYLVIADITGNKPNVFYELGIRHAMKTGTILITQDIHSVPSDLKSYYTFRYTYTDKAHEYEGYFKIFEHELHEKIDAFNSGQILSDSPVSDYLGFRREVFEQQLQREKLELRHLIVECGRSLEASYKVCEFLLEAVTNEKEIPLNDWPVIDTLPIDALFARLLTVQPGLFGQESTEMLRTILMAQRRALLMMKHNWEGFFSAPSEEGAGLLVMMLAHFMQQKQTFEKHWPNILEQFDSITTMLVVKSGRRKKKIKLN